MCGLIFDFYFFQAVYVIPLLIKPPWQKPDITLPLCHFSFECFTHHVTCWTWVEFSYDDLYSPLFKISQVLKKLVLNKERQTLTYHRHICRFLGKFPVHHKLNIIVLKFILQSRNVVTVLCTILGERRNFLPAKLSKCSNVGMPEIKN